MFGSHLAPWRPRRQNSRNFDRWPNAPSTVDLSVVDRCRAVGPLVDVFAVERSTRAVPGA
jgi:hypothetical protein